MSLEFTIIHLLIGTVGTSEHACICSVSCVPSPSDESKLMAFVPSKFMVRHFVEPCQENGVPSVPCVPTQFPDLYQLIMILG